VRPGRAADHSPLLVPRSWKSRAIHVPTVWATPDLLTGILYFTLPLLSAFANSQAVGLVISFVMSIRPSPRPPVHIEYVKDVTFLLKSSGSI